ncbi:MAG: SgcJ/EcaC family oxidoreductase [Acidobacteria bacterium]|nr:SgcJ/EcaC family oxidoreductase [Acidobacteriota bacterium]
MRIPALAVVVAMFSVMVCAAQEAEVRALVQKYVDAREARDEAAVRALFIADADQLVSTGEWRRGIENVVKGSMASSRANTGRRTITVETVRMLGKDVAIADGRYEIVGNTDPARKMWASIIAKKTSKGWKIAAIRNMLPSAPGN